MSSKHDALIEADLLGFRMDPALLGETRKHVKTAGCEAEALRILDWGCGRGRSVVLLRQEGAEAFGVDIDCAVLRNGYALFRARGLNLLQLLRHVDGAATFVDGAFDVVFSGETLEHVADLATVTRESFRLLRPGGISVHSFPSSRWQIEPHVYMPLGHWLPEGRVYRSAIFVGTGFAGCWLDAVPHAGWRRLLPESLGNNDFPAGYLLFLLAKPMTASLLPA